MDIKIKLLSKWNGDMHFVFVQVLLHVDICGGVNPSCVAKCLFTCVYVLVFQWEEYFFYCVFVQVMRKSRHTQKLGISNRKLYVNRSTADK